MEYHELQKEAAIARIGADRMALGLPCIPDKIRGDLAAVARLRAPSKHATAEDWDYLNGLLVNAVRNQQDSQTRFWVEAMQAARTALTSGQ